MPQNRLQRKVPTVNQESTARTAHGYILTTVDCKDRVTVSQFRIDCKYRVTVSQFRIDCKDRVTVSQFRIDCKDRVTVF